MNNFKCSISDREQFRTDYNSTFLRDFMDGMTHGKDPYNHIGLHCGISMGRTLQIAQDRALAGTL